MKISLIIPAYNEEERIEKTLVKSMGFMKDNFDDFEIIVVDDGSSDKTCNIVKDFSEIKLIELEKNQGKGAAVRQGMLSAIGDIRIFTDADLSTPIEEVKKAVYYLENESDVFIGSRALDHSMVKKHQPFYREFMGKVFNKIVQIFILWGIKDTQCGFKGFTKNSAEGIFARTVFDGFSFDVEVLYLARQLDFKISEVPIVWYNDERTTVSAISDSVNMFADIFRIKKYHKNNG